MENGGKTSCSLFPPDIIKGFFFNHSFPKIRKNHTEARLRFVEAYSVRFDTFPDYAFYEIIPFVWDCWPNEFEKFCSWIEKYKVKTAFFTCKETAQLIKRIYPDINSIYCLYNTLNSEKIRQMAEVPIDDIRFDKETFSMVTIGRFAKQKLFHLIPQIVDNIKKIGINKPFKWNMIVSGDACNEETEQEIMKYGLQNQVIVLGAKDNPYPILKASDLYVCTSDSESFSYTIAESKIIHTPLVSNDFPVAYEVVDDSVGWICNINNMTGKIADINSDKDGMYTKMKDSINRYNYNNEKIIREFTTIL